MGSDIALFVEHRADADTWQKAGAVFSRITDQFVDWEDARQDGTWHEVVEADVDRPWAERDYDLFSVFGLVLRPGVTPIAPLRGLPKGVSAEVADELGRDDYLGHS